MLTVPAVASTNTSRSPPMASGAARVEELGVAPGKLALTTCWVVLKVSSRSLSDIARSADARVIF